MEPFLGEIKMVSFNFAPRGYAFCNGQMMSIAQNSAVFALLGTMFGGNGQTTFGLPDYQGRVPVGMGTGAGLSQIQQGEKSGVENVTLMNTQMPMHTHSVMVAGVASTDVATAPSGTNNVLGASAAAGPSSAAIWSSALNSPTALNPNQILPSGGNQPVAIRNPYLGTNFIIAMEGIFPSRD